jgi:Carboxypeptidase regulatory-like domain
VFALLLLLASAASTVGVNGTVIDPQALPVAGARVEIVCDGRAAATHTNDRGEFSINVGDDHRTCSIAVTQDGFARVTQPIPTRGAANLVLRLQVAGVSEVVNVVDAAPRPEIREAIGSVVLDGEELQRVFSHTEDMIRFAGLLGAGAGAASVYVDGLPATVMPSPDLVRQIRVNAAPFSAEHGDGDVTRLQIITTSPARRFRVNPGGSFLSFGGGDGVRDGLHSASSSGQLGVSGPVPGIPLTLSSTLQSSASENELALQAVVPSGATRDVFSIDAPGPGATYARQSRSLMVSGYFAPSNTTRGHAAVSLTRASGSNVGVGGLVLPSAGLASRSSAASLQAAANTMRRGLLFEASFIARDVSSSMRANSLERGVSVAGLFVGGGASVALQQSDRLTWTAKQVTRSSSFHPWAVGLIVGSARQTHVQTPNPLGSLEFDNADAFTASLTGAPTATWLVTRGSGSIAYHGLTLSPFVQKTLVQKNRIQLDGGVRADYQTGVGTSVSPRLWAATAWRGFDLQAGGGLFVSFVPDQVFVTTLFNDGHHLQPFVASDVSLDDVAANQASEAVIRTRLAPRLGAARQVMQRVALARPVGHFTPSIEYTFTRDSSRLGSDRLAAGDNWIDVIDSNRSASRHRVAARLQYVRKGQTVSGHYEWLRAFDNGDSPFSYPERPGQIGAEWAPSAGLAPHSATIAGVLRLPLSIYAAVSDTWQSPAPYNVTTGADADGNGLFNERGGRHRNSGAGASQHILSVHASRRIQLPINRWLAGAPRINVGVHLDNLLDHRNYTSLGSVVGSPTFGLPLSATSSRSARISFSVE